MRLLNRTIRNYGFYSALLIPILSPFFYFAMQHLFTRAMDRELMAHKIDFHKALSHLKSADDLRLYHLLNDEFALKSTEKIITKDTLYTLNTYDSVRAEFVPYRILKTGARIANKNYELTISESMVKNSELITAIMVIQLLLLVLLVGGLVFINHKLSKIIWNPFYEILERLREYRIGQHNSIQLPTSSTTEFTELAVVVKDLISKDHEAYISQKEFTENAAHELQTPLAICRSKLELLAQTTELTQEQADLIASLLNATDRISRMNKDLLMLSKIENQQFIENTDVDIINLTQKSITAYHGQANDKGLSITTHLEPGTVVLANPTLMELLINNLVSNAVRHSPDNGTIEVTANEKEFIITNTGVPLTFPEKLFNRFHREYRTSTGSGLGLSIVKKITDVSGFSITYSHIRGKHRFALHFQNPLTGIQN